MSNDTPVALVGPKSNTSSTFFATAANFTTASGSGTLTYATGSAITVNTVGSGGPVCVGSYITCSSIGSGTYRLVSLASGQDGAAGAVYNVTPSPTTPATSVAFTCTQAIASEQWTTQKWNAPYTTSAFSDTSTSGSTVQGRMVSFGVSVQYVGTVLNEGGILYQYTQPTHNNLNTPNTTLSLLGSQDETCVTRITSKKHIFSTASTSDSEFSYPGPFNLETNAQGLATAEVYVYSNGYNFADSINNNCKQTNSSLLTTFPAGCGGAPMMLVLSTPAAGNFEIEIVGHVEYVGSVTSPFHTTTHSDSRGFEIVNTAAQKVRLMKTNSPEKSLLTLMGQAVREAANDLMPVAADWMKGTIKRGLGASMGRLSITNG